MSEEIEYVFSQKELKSGNNKKRILVAVILILVLISAYSIYSNYFSKQTYSDLKDLLIEAIEGDSSVEYILSDLQEDKCYWIRPMYNSGEHYVELIEYSSNDSCMGPIENKTTIKLDSALNMGSKDCLCGNDNYKIIKTVNEDGIYFVVDI